VKPSEPNGTMTMSLAAALALAAQCAPSIAPQTLLSVVQVESRFNPLAIGVNGAPRIAISAATKGEAVARASALVAAGRSVDLGLAQINSKNLGWLGLSIEDAFDPCANLAAAARVLQEGYARSDVDRVGQQAALQTALSFYNTGRADRGFANGYVGKVTRAAAHIVPAIDAPAGPRPPSAPEPAAADIAPSSTPAWDVFHEVNDGASTFVIKVSSQSSGGLQ
jgi:type IV secretion system protein VirB1